MAQAPAAPSSLAGAPFSALPFFRTDGHPPRRYWAPPRAYSYAQASIIGTECATQLVAWLRANDGHMGQALLIGTLTDLYAGRDTVIALGYRAGFAAQLALAAGGFNLQCGGDHA